MTRFTPGLYVSGGGADFGQLTIGGKLDPQWCAEHGVLPWFAGNLLHPGNKWKPPDRKLAELVEKYTHQDEATEKNPKNLVAPEAVAPLVGDVKVPLVIPSAGGADGQGATRCVAETLATLLDNGKDHRDGRSRGRCFVRVCRGTSRYEVDADEARRGVGAFIAAYLREREDAENQGKSSWGFAGTRPSARTTSAATGNTRGPALAARPSADRPAKKWATWYLAALRAEVPRSSVVGRRAARPRRCRCRSSSLKGRGRLLRVLQRQRLPGEARGGRFGTGRTSLRRSTRTDSRTRSARVASSSTAWRREVLAVVWYDEGARRGSTAPKLQDIGFDGTTLSVGIVGHGGP
jgi:hypothetical protein